jgi:hypothetical protein
MWLVTSVVPLAISTSAKPTVLASAAGEAIKPGTNAYVLPPSVRIAAACAPLTATAVGVGVGVGAGVGVAVGFVVAFGVGVAVAEEVGVDVGFAVPPPPAIGCTGAEFELLQPTIADAARTASAEKRTMCERFIRATST